MGTEEEAECGIAALGGVDEEAVLGRDLVDWEGLSRAIMLKSGAGELEEVEGVG
jgi:hypothetical protein